MLDVDTKARIDSARDILVGKVPDPKSQVEQITIALIYNFMDDMDRQSEELGGKTTFFSGEFKKFGWTHLLDKRLGGHERLFLCAEGIEKMNENTSIPQLFRDIFRGVFLPYRDPETLNLFLKEINGFRYDHSERLGDTFEYPLSVMDSQGAAGQFRTPRHIINFIVAVVNPRKNETVLDPACGTAGFLISSYKHILANHGGPGSVVAKSVRDGAHLSELTPDEKSGLMSNFCGYDISPDMVRLSRVNLYLHGFAQPRIHEYDTLTSEQRWDERFDVIMANPPFMTPKGGIRPHNRFSIKATRSEVLFVDYIAEHLNPAGRAGVIVPEGIIFQSQNAYKALRRMLVENYLWAVVSLPGGVFNPYSGVKTCILFFDGNLARRRDEVLFVKVENDGFGLGAQRRPNGKNDLPEALEILISCRDTEKTREEGMALCVSRRRLLDNPDVNLSGDRYRETKVRGNAKWPMVKLGDQAVFEVVSGGTPSSSNASYWDGLVNWASLVDLPAGAIFNDLHTTKRHITESGLHSSSAVLLPKKSIIVSTRATIGRIAVSQIEVATNQGFKNLIIKDFGRVNERYVAYALTRLVHEMDRMASGGTFKELSKSNFSQLRIPLPPLAEQEQIVAELEGYRKIIEGARQIIANYKPAIPFNSDWPWSALDDVCERITDGTHQTPTYQNAGVMFLSSKDVITGTLDWSTPKYISEELHKELSKRVVPHLDDILLAKNGVNSGIGAIVDRDEVFDIYVSLALLRPDKTKVHPRYLLYAINSENSKRQFVSRFKGIGVPNLHLKEIKQVVVPIPPLDEQLQIITSIEAERTLVDSNRRLIELFEAKIKTRLDEIWGES